MKFLWLLLFVPLFAEPTVVSSDSARYDGENIFLKGNVHVEHAMGELFAKSATLRRDEKKTTKLDFPWIKLEQDVHFALPEEKHLFCPFASCDYVQKRAFIEGGLHYSDPEGDLFAKRGVIEYTEASKKLKATKIVLIGDVQMRSRKKAQYALADQVEYYPDEELMIMTAKNRVLFYDQERQMELAAFEVRAKRDENGQESVQGVGDVRFVFSAEELEKLRGIDATSRKP